MAVRNEIYNYRINWDLSRGPERIGSGESCTDTYGVRCDRSTSLDPYS